MNKQRGFSTVVLLLGLLLIVAVVFTGYYVWNNQNNKDDNKAEVAPATTTKQETKQDAPSPVKDEQKYLVIKEWGVKMPVSSQFSDLIINRYCDNDMDFCAFIYSPTQIKLAKEINATCYVPENMNNVGSVVRYRDPSAQYMGTTMGQAFSPNKKLGDWYYGYKMPNEATCMLNGTNNSNNSLAEYYSDFEKVIYEYINKIQIL
jgi:cytoskeletal protein RodZ